MNSDSKKQGTSVCGETIYILSREDAERISEMIKMIETTFWELLADRRVDFPNSIYSKAYHRLKKELVEDF